MNTVVSSIVEKGRRPLEMRLALRSKTSPFDAVLRQISVLKKVKAEAPHRVLGTDLIALLSHRMRALLQNDEQPPGSADTFYKHISSFSDPGDCAHSPESPFTFNSQSEKATARGFAAMESVLERHNSLPVSANSRRVSPSAEPYALHQRQIALQPDWERARAVSNHDHNSSLPKSKAAPHGRHENAMRSLLAKKLQDYWELSKPQQTSEKDSNRIADSAARNESPSPVPLPWRDASRRAQSWPEKTAQQLARKVRSMGADLSSSGTLTTINSGLPEKVEIQNVFNIEMKSQAGNTDSMDDLSERISDLLRDQALQHGIDIT